MPVNWYRIELKIFNVASRFEIEDRRGLGMGWFPEFVFELRLQGFT